MYMCKHTYMKQTYEDKKKKKRIRALMKEEPQFYILFTYHSAKYTFAV